jgi:hypothetical protein
MRRASLRTAVEGGQGHEDGDDAAGEALEEDEVGAVVEAGVLEVKAMAAACRHVLQG